MNYLALINQVVTVLAIKLPNQIRIHRRSDGSITSAAQHTLEQKHIGLLIINDKEFGVKNVDALSIIIRIVLFVLTGLCKHQRFIEYV